jgi:methionyl-tRNA formyltransferase
MRIGILANSRFALPSIEEMGAQGLLAGVLMPETAHELAQGMSGIEGAGHIPWRVRSMPATARTPWRALTKMLVKRHLVRWVSAIQPDVVCVLSFPYKIAPSVLDMPRYGFFNFHPGLLPSYRGPDPTFWQMKNLESHGGLTVHRMDAGWDTGPIALIERIAIQPGDTHGMHQSRIAAVAANALNRLVAELKNGSIRLSEQDSTSAGYYPRPSPSDVVIDWTQPAKVIRALTKACNPWNKGAVTSLGGTRLWLVEVSVGSPKPSVEIAPGTITVADPAEGVHVVCGDGQTVRIDIASTEEGFMSGKKLAEVGLRTGGPRLHPSLRFDSGSRKGECGSSRKATATGLASSA